MKISKLELFIDSRKETNLGKSLWKARDVYTLLELKQWKDFKTRILRINTANNPIKTTIDGNQEDYFLTKEQTLDIISNTSPRNKSRKTLEFIHLAKNYLINLDMPTKGVKQQSPSIKAEMLIGTVLRSGAERDKKIYDLEQDNKNLRDRMANFERLLVEFEAKQYEKEQEVEEPRVTKKELFSNLKKQITNSILTHIKEGSDHDARIIAFRTANSIINEDRFVFDGNEFKTLPKFGKLTYTKTRIDETIGQLKEYQRRLDAVITNRL